MRKVLNLYAGIGGNRKLWEDVQVVAVEIDPKIAGIYADFFPDDEVVVADAHQFLLENFEDFDFIWDSPECPTHSKLRKTLSCSQGAKPVYPDMQLYEEILFLTHYYEGKWCVENVIAFYEPLIMPQTVQRHWFWANFHIPDTKSIKSDGIDIVGGRHDPLKTHLEKMQDRHGFNLDKYKVDKRTILRNCVAPELGKHIFDSAFRFEQMKILVE